jgi:hypothetical protein
MEHRISFFLKSRRETGNITFITKYRWLKGKKTRPDTDLLPPLTGGFQTPVGCFQHLA